MGIHYPAECTHTAAASSHPTTALPLRHRRMHIVAAAKKTEKEPTKQEVFLGVKGNAQLLGMKGASVRCCLSTHMHIAVAHAIAVTYMHILLHHKPENK